jgi:hypothetical protein
MLGNFHSNYRNRIKIKEALGMLTHLEAFSNLKNIKLGG